MVKAMPSPVYRTDTASSWSIPAIPEGKATSGSEPGNAHNLLGSLTSNLNRSNQDARLIKAFLLTAQSPGRKSICWA